MVTVSNIVIKYTGILSAVNVGIIAMWMIGKMGTIYIFDLDDIVKKYFNLDQFKASWDVVFVVKVLCNIESDR